MDVARQTLGPAPAWIIVQEEDEALDANRKRHAGEALGPKRRPAGNSGQQGRRHCALDSLGPTQSSVPGRVEPHGALPQLSERPLRNRQVREPCRRQVEEGPVNRHQPALVANRGEHGGTEDGLRSLAVRRKRVIAQVRRCDYQSTAPQIGLGRRPSDRTRGRPEPRGRAAVAPPVIGRCVRRLIAVGREIWPKQIQRAQRSDDLARLATGEAVEEQPALPGSHAQRGGAIIVNGAAAETTACPPKAAEALDQRAALLLQPVRGAAARHGASPQVQPERAAFPLKFLPHSRLYEAVVVSSSEIAPAGERIVYRVSRDPGTSFEPAQVIHTRTGSVYSEAQAIAADGRLHFVWVEAPLGARSEDLRARSLSP